MTPRARDESTPVQATPRARAVPRAELEAHRTGSRRRMRRALAGLGLGLVSLLWGWSRLLQLVADAKAAGGQANAFEMAREDPAGFTCFVLGLLGAFASTLLVALSFLHARHVEHALAEHDARGVGS